LSNKNIVRILIKKFDKNIKLPTYKTSGSSGMDLVAYTKKKVTLYPGKTALIPTGISVAIPKNYEIQIRPRSGLAAKNNISVLNTPGTVDSDYRGEIKIILINLGKKPFVIKYGDRIAQMVLCPISKAKFLEVESLPKTIRGKGGFGSTGK
jgi:dUTP pyrophosphatase